MVPTWNPMQNQPFPTKYWTGPGQAATTNLEGDDSRVIMDRAVPFIRQAAGEKRPFLAVIWFHAPHQPVVAGPEFRAMYSSFSDGEQNYYGVITALDVQIGRLRKELRELGIADNTMLWFASDNGPEGDTGDAGTNRGSAGKFRGRKRSLWEGGIHVPGLLEWPARIKAGSVTAIPCSTLDYFPTTLDILGFKMKGQPEPIDGVSLLPLIEGAMKERPVPIPFETLGGTGSKNSRGSPRMALVDSRYKLLTDMNGTNDVDLLFDLINDPGESTNIVAAHADIAQSMKAKLAEFHESSKNSLAGKDYAEAFTPGKDDIHPSEAGATRKVKK
jgi:arylsulfatase A-like enzyme